jgi:hypothetical protein
MPAFVRGRVNDAGGNAMTSLALTCLISSPIETRLASQKNNLVVFPVEMRPQSAADV